MKTTAERKKECTRSRALMHLLRDRLGENSVYGFAAKYDDLAKKFTSTKLSNKWQPFFNGERPLTATALKLLSALFPDATMLHLNGPADLWLSMWGTLNDLRTVIADDLHAWQSYDVALAEFEAELLLAEHYGAQLTLQHLTKAVAFHRLHHDFLGLDGAGTCRCVRRCLDDTKVREALTRLAVLDDISNDLEIVCGAPRANAPVEERWNALETKLSWIN
ncbi:MAG: hypothetical protein ABIQ42_01460 [Rhodoferax sp.]|uniref:hypothetical protein n=1 Tax=Rhodoferax sp. TaxID=50421 RepID=UPI003262F290